jgi:hypothetical protein
MPFQTEKTHLFCSQLTYMDYKKLFNKYPSSSSHVKIYVCLHLDLLKATSIYVRRARDKVSSVYSFWEVTTLKTIVLVLHKLLHSSANVGSCKASTLEILDIANKRQMKQPKDRMSLTIQVKTIACSAIVNHSLFHPAATDSWQGWALYKLANPLYE